MIMGEDKQLKQAKQLPRSYGMRQLLSIKHQVFPFDGEWLKLFGNPEKGVTWFVWGNSGNGKSTVCVQLAKLFSNYGRVLYLSLEEKAGKSIISKLDDAGIKASNKEFQLLTESSFSQLVTRLNRQRSADIIIIDSLQYINIKYEQYKILTNQFPNKTFVFISHAQGRNPKGATADSIHFDAGVKIWVEGGRISVKHRFEGGGGIKDIIPELANHYWYGNSTDLNIELANLCWEFLKSNGLFGKFETYVKEAGYRLDMFNKTIRAHDNKKE